MNIILSMLSYSRTSEYWMNSHLYNEDTIIVHADIPINNDMKSWEFVEGTMGTSVAKATMDKLKLDSQVLTTKECFEWRDTILSYLKEQKSEADKLRADYTICYLSYLALNLMRLATKDLWSTSIHIIKTTDERIRNFFNNSQEQDALPDFSILVHPPPTYQSLVFFQTTFNKNSSLFKKIMWGVVYSFTYGEDSFFKGIFKASCVLSLSYTGLSTLNWFHRAMAYQKMNFQTMAKYTFTERTEKFYSDIHNFYKKQEGSESQGRTWIFARLFDDEYLSE